MAAATEEMQTIGRMMWRHPTLDPQVEELISGNVQATDGRSMLTLAPAVQRSVVDAIRAAVEKALPTCGASTPNLLCPPRIRLWVRRMIEPSMEHVAVLSYNEIVRDVEVESRGMVIMDGASAHDSG